MGTLNRVVGQAIYFMSSKYIAEEMGNPQPNKTEPPASLSKTAENP